MSNLSEDDEFPRHGLGDDEKQLALSEADKAFNAMMCLLEHNRFEESSSLMTCVASHGLEIEKQLFYHFFIILASSKLSKKHHLFENNYHFLFFKVSKIIVFFILAQLKNYHFLII